MPEATPKDGTAIAYERVGAGPVLGLGFEGAANALAQAPPHAERYTIPDQGHVADPKLLAAVLERFYS